MLLIFVVECGPCSGAGGTPGEEEHAHPLSTLAVFTCSLL